MPIAKRLPSGSYRCRLYIGTETSFVNGVEKKKRIYKSFTAASKKAAERMALEYSADLEHEQENINNPTVGQAMDAYIQNRSAVLSPGTIREYKRSRKNDLQGIMDIKLKNLTQEQIQVEINKESLNHSPKTIRNMHGLLSSVLNAYRPDFALKTDLPKKQRSTLYIPSDGEIQTLMAYVKGSDMEIPILLAAFGPMRRGEIAALDSDHVDGNDVFVEYSLALDENNKWVRKSPKSAAGKRHIIFPDFVAKKLQNINGSITKLNPSMITDRFSDILDKSGLPHFRFHDLRHYCASAQHALGVPDAYIMARGGWEDDATLKKVYRHVLNDKNKMMNQKINEHFSSMM